MRITARLVLLSAIGPLLGGLVAPPAEAQEGDAPVVPMDSTPPAVHALDISSRPVPRIDGRLNDIIWRAATPTVDFVQVQPDPGAAATERTEARVLYDDEALYVGVRLHDSAPDSIIRRLSPRDDDVFSDWFYVALDSDRDRRTAYVFGVNPRGVMRDLLLFDDVEEDVGWNAVWEVAVASDSTGWSAEFRIPLSQLHVIARAAPGEEAVWGIDLQRRIARRDEIAHWSPVPARRTSMVSVFGDLRGLRDVQAPRPISMSPYSVARLTRAPGDAADPFYQPNDLFGSIGADLKLGLTSNVTLTAAINPDFSQVEDDPSVVNTTGYRTFFTEKRPFFLEDAQLFDVRIATTRIFHSRRIGREPQGRPDPDSDFVEVPDASQILGAAKLVGESSTGWSIGALGAVTRGESALLADSLGGRSSQVVEPPTASGVMRLRKEFGDGAGTVGGLVTAMNRRIDELTFLTSAAYTGGLDGRFRFGENNYELAASLLGSHVEGSPDAIDRLQRAQGRYLDRPDATHLSYDSTRTQLQGAAATASLTRIGRGAWTWGVAGYAISPGFEVNDLGYQRNADVISQSTYLGYDLVRGDVFLRRLLFEVNQWTSWSFGGERTGTGANIEGRIVFGSFWGTIAGVERNLPALFPDGLRGGPALRIPATTRLWGTIYSDRRRAVDAQVSATLIREDETHSRTVVLRPMLRGRPFTLLELSIEPSITWRIDAEDYIGRRDASGVPHYLFAEVDQTTASITTRAALTLSPTLSLQLYAQPYLTSRSFSQYKEVVDPRGDHFDDRFRQFGRQELRYDASADRFIVDLLDDSGTLSFADPSYRFTEFRSNLLLRWDYRAGSTLFLAWNRERTDYDRDASYDLGRDFSRITGLEGRQLVPTTDVLIFKMSYWLGR